LNEDNDADDCAELDCEDDSSEFFADRRRVADLNAFGNDFGQPASDRDEDTTTILDSQPNDFAINPPPSQRRRLSADPHEIFGQFWTPGIRERYAPRQISPQHPHTPSPHITYTSQSTWLQGSHGLGI
jgi:hypothetical protein